MFQKCNDKSFFKKYKKPHFWAILGSFPKILRHRKFCKTCGSINNLNDCKQNRHKTNEMFLRKTGKIETTGQQGVNQ